ncbi:hypothetical protein SUDANB6_02401 [Streptomyces sp. enrichment culture]|uniref:hypothetical protein n=1 Tax=Streptomyces sp. enrichment culture TaxID=1795815 RepID=UPI003F56643D
MPASQTNAQPQPTAVSVVPGVSMRDLLAACAAATALSTPPRAPDPALPAPAPRPAGERREAA